MKVHSRISYLSRPVQKLMTGSTQEKVSNRLVGKSLRAGLDLHGIMREMNYTCGRAARDYRDFNPVSDHYSRNHGSRDRNYGGPRLRGRGCPRAPLLSVERETSKYRPINTVKPFHGRYNFQ